MVSMYGHLIGSLNDKDFLIGLNLRHNMADIFHQNILNIYEKQSDWSI